MLRLSLALSAMIILTACNFPRGGAVHSEIIAAANATVPEIALYKIERQSLVKYKSWPDTGNTDQRGWLRHKPQGDVNPIAAGDLLNIAIWDSEETSLLSNGRDNVTYMKDVKVSSGGTVFLPFSGAVQVAGLSETSARNRIQRKLTEVVPSAQVQLSVTKGFRGSVSLVSGVAKPGSYPLDSEHFTVLNAIAVAGGTHSGVDNPQLRLVRGGKVYTESLSVVLENPDKDTVLRGGDKLSVESDERYFRSLGAASKEAIIPFTKNSITALDAMSLIGGLSDNRADPKGIMILRQYKSDQVRTDGTGPANERVVFVFDLTSADGLFSAGEFNIQSKDTVLVTESSVATANVVLQFLARFAAAATDINSLAN